MQMHAASSLNLRHFLPGPGSPTRLISTYLQPWERQPLGVLAREVLPRPRGTRESAVTPHQAGLLPPWWRPERAACPGFPRPPLRRRPGAAALGVGLLVLREAIDVSEADGAQGAPAGGQGAAAAPRGDGQGAGGQAETRRGACLEPAAGACPSPPGAAPPVCSTRSNALPRARSPRRLFNTSERFKTSPHPPTHS